ncbi:sodium:alanine symporter family protein [uncultured Parasphingopyxis sp.]|uniref:alanine/glycine:cation symporter family protein n=1 Tax=uncultured Parasphingopyxis sp. TaxID=1547918 RepID=UPI002620D810|nr:amino acid carrier protein [uncultured Parasphingopyxis sp.]
MIGWIENTLAGLLADLNALVFTSVPIMGVNVTLIVIWLAIPMFIFTIWLGFINVRALGQSVRIVRDKTVDHDAPGTISQFSALTTALSGTVGLGNIAGVAIAIATGGPGAAFWMFVIGFFAMTVKCMEVTLGHKYRTIDPDGSIRGGPMYAMKNGLAARGKPRFGHLLGWLYAFFALFGAISLVQVNQSYVQVAAVTGFENGTIYGIILAALVGLVVIGGVTWLGRVTSMLVPAMAGIYLIGVFTIILTNLGQLPDAIATIVGDAFTGGAAAGGMLGAFVIGMQRAVYSSEAGVGSAVIAHAQAKTREPASEGLVALLEPFIDTVVVCSLGAIAIVISGTYYGGEDIGIVSDAFARISDWFPILLAVAVFLFAYSTLCSWGFYGLQAWGYLVGEGPIRDTIYKVFYVVTIPVGAILPIQAVIDLVDSAFFLMCIPNVIAIYIFAPEIRREIRGYLERSRAKRNEETTP